MTTENDFDLKIFAENAINLKSQNDPTKSQIGQFGSSKDGLLSTNNPTEIQELQAWSDGLFAEIFSQKKFPTYQELNGLYFVITTLLKVLQTTGIVEYQTTRTYTLGSFTQDADGKFYRSIFQGDNKGNDLSDTNYWQFVFDSKTIADQLNILEYNDSKGNYLYKETSSSSDEFVVQSDVFSEPRSYTFGCEVIKDNDGTPWLFVGMYRSSFRMSRYSLPNYPSLEGAVLVEHVSSIHNNTVPNFKIKKLGNDYYLYFLDVVLNRFRMATLPNFPNISGFVVDSNYVANTSPQCFDIAKDDNDAYYLYFIDRENNITTRNLARVPLPNYPILGGSITFTASDFPISNNLFYDMRIHERDGIYLLEAISDNDALYTISLSNFPTITTEGIVISAFNLHTYLNSPINGIAFIVENDIGYLIGHSGDYNKAKRFQLPYINTLYNFTVNIEVYNGLPEISRYTNGQVYEYKLLTLPSDSGRFAIGINNIDTPIELTIDGRPVTNTDLTVGSLLRFFYNEEKNNFEILK